MDEESIEYMIKMGTENRKTRREYMQKNQYKKLSSKPWSFDEPCKFACRDHLKGGVGVNRTNYEKCRDKCRWCKASTPLSIIVDIITVIASVAATVGTAGAAAPAIASSIAWIAAKKAASKAVGYGITSLIKEINDNPSPSCSDFKNAKNDIKKEAERIQIEWKTRDIDHGRKGIPSGFCLPYKADKSWCESGQAEWGINMTGKHDRFFNYLKNPKKIGSTSELSKILNENKELNSLEREISNFKLSFQDNHNKINPICNKIYNPFSEKAQACKRFKENYSKHIKNNLNIIAKNNEIQDSKTIEATEKNYTLLKNAKYMDSQCLYNRDKDMIYTGTGSLTNATNACNKNKDCVGFTTYVSPKTNMPSYVLINNNISGVQNLQLFNGKCYSKKTK